MVPFLISYHISYWSSTVPDVTTPPLITENRKSPFYASLWWLTAQDKRLTLASNVGSVK